MHLHQFIQEFAIVIMMAAFMGIIFKSIKLPSSLAFIFSGLLLGPHISFLPTITNHEVISVWAEMGIIFVFFNLGIEMQFSKFSQFGQKSLIATMIEVPSCFLVGFTCGYIIGLGRLESVFLGCILSISSTTIIAKSFEEFKLKREKFTQNVFGILIFEDIMAIIMLVLLATVSATKNFSGAKLTSEMIKIMFFLTVTFVSGIFFIPTIVKKIKPLLSKELLLLLAVGACFGMVMLASHFGLSPALGAFLVGMIFSNTQEAQLIEEQIEPLKNIFTAIFFVSIGMLVNPNKLIQFSFEIILLSIVLIISKILFVFMGSTIAGQKLNDSAKSALSMAQIGEFAFIIAALGIQLRVIDQKVYAIAIGVSVITTFLTPLFIKKSNFLTQSFMDGMPNKMKTILQNYEKTTFIILSDVFQKKQIKLYLIRMVIFANVIIAITALSHRQLPKLLKLFAIPNSFHAYIMLGLTLILSAPFFWALLRGAIRQNIDAFKTTKTLLVYYILNYTRYLVIVVLSSIQLSLYVSKTTSSLVLILALSILGKFLQKRIGTFYLWVEKRFINNLNSMDSSEIKLKMLDLSEHLLETTMEYIPVPPEFSLVGESLEKLQIRNKFDLNIVLIQRGKNIEIPTGATQILPNDILAVIGESEKTERLRSFITENQKKTPIEGDDIMRYQLHHILVDEYSGFLNKTIKDLFTGKNLKLRVVGVQKTDQSKIITPSPDQVFTVGDVVWVVGKVKTLNEFLLEINRPSTTTEAIFSTSF